MAGNLAEGLSVILLLARDTDRTAAFYRDVIGLPLVAEAHDARHRHYACQTGSVYFTIQLSKDLAKEAPGHGYDFLQLCFTVHDLNAFAARLEEHALAPLHPPRPFEHTTYITLLDPDGRHVRVMTPWAK
jgi:catechol 2,3-dioxygenase-like lactoylglutathione lyase family enzyme